MRFQKSAAMALCSVILVMTASCGNGGSGGDEVIITLAMPENLTATGISSEQIHLHWADSNQNEQGYQIERSANGTDFQLIDTVGVNGTTYTDVVPEKEKLYHYRVRAYYIGVVSGFSNVAIAATVIAPADLNVAGASTTEISVNWKDQSAREDGFEVQRSTDGMAFDTAGLVPADETNFIDSGLTPGTVYHYKVRAFDNGGSVSEFTTSGGTATFTIPWACAFGEEKADPAHAITRTLDFGYVVAGNTYSFGAGLADFWLVKLDLNGEVVWQKAYGGAKTDNLASIAVTQDNGFIVAGETNSFGAGAYDFWVLKVDSEGIVEWEKTFGGLDNDYARSARQTSDGGFIVAGESRSFSTGGYNAWVVKLDSSGGMEWEYVYGGSVDDFVSSILQLKDNSFLLYGHTFSFGVKKSDLWLVRLSALGEIQGQLTYGGEGYEYASSILLTMDDGYFITARTHSFGAGLGDAWLLKIIENGAVEWQKAFGEYELDYMTSAAQNTDGSYLVAGETYSFGQGEGDAWIMHLDSKGSPAFEKAYGGEKRDHLAALCPLVDGLAAAGYTLSFGAGEHDLWSLKIDPDGTIDFLSGSGATVTDTKARIEDTPVSAAVAYGIRVASIATVMDTQAVVTVTSCKVDRQAP